MLWFYFHYRFTQLMFDSSCIRWFVSRFSSNLVHHIPIQSISIQYTCTPTSIVYYMYTIRDGLHAFDWFVSLHIWFSISAWDLFRFSSIDGINCPTCVCVYVCNHTVNFVLQMKDWKIWENGHRQKITKTKTINTTTR